MKATKAMKVKSSAKVAKKSVNKSVKKSVKKSMKKTGGMKKKAKKVSVIAKGRLAKVLVFRGSREHTVGGLKKENLTKNKHGKIVSKKRSAKGKKSKWIVAVGKARAALKIKGFAAVGGKSSQGKALLAKARSFYKK